jgi:hypothetical protein
MPTARANAAAAALNGAVYVAGGIVPVGGDFDLVDVVERFDPPTGRWTTVTKLRTSAGWPAPPGWVACCTWLAVSSATSPTPPRR